MNTPPAVPVIQRDASESIPYRLVLVVLGVFAVWCWFLLGPANPGYALLVAMGTSALEPSLAFPLMRRVTYRHWRVSSGERLLQRMLGVSHFNSLLNFCGWNSLIRRMRGFSGTKAGLLALERHAEAGAVAHTICFAIHVLLSGLALLMQRRLRGALMMLLPGLALHFYPILLQRSQLFRLRPLLEKAGSETL